ncbi:MAG: hypothetical protein ACWA44_02690 [Thiotrichales bacterium]
MLFKNYITHGNIKSAIEMLSDSSEKNQLLARFAQLNTDITHGIINDADARIERNKIVKSASDMYEEMMKPFSTTPFPPAQYPKAANTGEVSLSNLYKHYRRRNPKLAKRIEALIDDYAAYNASSEKDAAYDITGRRLTALGDRKSKIIAEHQSLQKDSREGKLSKVQGLIVETIPSYDNLSEAWDVCHGLGMRSTWIPDALKSRVSDDEVKIRIAEDIESFIARL